jgi:hypothetical protein
MIDSRKAIDMRRRRGFLAALALLAALHAGCGGPGVTSPGEPLTVPPPPPPDTGCGSTRYVTGDGALDALQDQFRPVLERNRREFVGRTGSVRGFGAGTSYPQVWLRDSATLIPATRYFYPREYLTTWLEEHLAHQRPGGELWDWIAAAEPGQLVANAPRASQIFGAGGVVLSADKNTTVTDQETSAVDAAWSVFTFTGDHNWLRQSVAGRPLVDRLDAALRFVLESRFDPATGLVTSALTADWGDVSPTHADQRAIYLDEATPVVVGLYANALFARAARQLSELHDALGDSARRREWARIADEVRARINRQLWQEDRGFYRIHQVVLARGAAGTFDSSDVFAMGGNAMAVLNGVADDRQAGLVFATAESRRRQHGFTSVAAALLPPYPTGFFAHPILREPFTYQNGGQWDWWSGRMLLAMFRRGYSAYAHAQLLALASRVSASGGLYEWYSRDGRGQGSGSYAGNAGALAGAVFQGLYGLDSRADGLDVTVRLGELSGSVTVCEPALARTLDYSYVYEPGQRRARLQIRSNAPGAGRLSLRIPGEADVAALAVDGAPVAFEIDEVGNDRYARLTTTWSSRSIELLLR